MINPKDVVEGLAHQRESQKCTHPTEHIRDLPTGSICRKCGEGVAPYQKWDSAQMDWMGRTKKSVFPVFPSCGEGR